jgi:hypothetical protein
MTLAYRHARLVLSRARKSKRGIRAAEKALCKLETERLRRLVEARRMGRAA